MILVEHLLYYIICTLLGGNALASQSVYNVSYMELSYPSVLSGNSTYLTGVRQVSGADVDTVYISANSLALDPLTANQSSIAVIYKGSIVTGDGDWYSFIYPDGENRTVTGTYFYGPNSGPDGVVQAAGAYSTAENGVDELGLFYEGYLNGTGSWLTLHPQVLDSDNTVFQTAAHSTMGGLVVGDFYTFVVASRAFVYDVAQDSYSELAYPGVQSISAYGIWHDGGEMYSITGGVNGLKLMDSASEYAYVCRWNSSAHNASDWTFYAHDNSAAWTHFEGIYAPTNSSDYNSGAADEGTALGPYQYTFVSDWESEEDGDWHTSLVIMPNASGFVAESQLIWVDYWYPGSVNNSANTVYMNYAIGKFCYPDSLNIARGYIATVTVVEVANDDNGGSSSGGGIDETTVAIIASSVSVALVVLASALCLCTGQGRALLFKVTGNSKFLDSDPSMRKPLNFDGYTDSTGLSTTSGGEVDPAGGIALKLSESAPTKC